MAKRYHIDASQLVKHDACEYWQERFGRDFPNGFTLSARNVRKAMELGYPLSWVAYRLCDAHSDFDESREHDDAEALAMELGNLKDEFENGGRDEERAAVRRAHNAMQKVATKWELFKIQHPDWLPANY